VPTTATQAAHLDRLGQRARACREGRQAHTDNMTSVLGDERSASLDLRLAGHPMDEPGKIAAARHETCHACRAPDAALQPASCRVNRPATGTYRQARTPASR
jgi:hypothetical protein